METYSPAIGKLYTDYTEDGSLRSTLFKTNDTVYGVHNILRHSVLSFRWLL